MHGTPKKLRKLAIGAVVATAATIAAACSADPPSQPLGHPSAGALAREAVALSVENAGDASQNQLLAGIRQATARYHRVDAAIADGYVFGSPCESMPGQGIGIHYRKASLIDGVVDPFQPELLVYEPRDNGDIELVAVTFVVRASMWDRRTAVRPCWAIRSSRTNVFRIGAAPRSRTTSCTCGSGSTIPMGCMRRRTRR